ncbi:GTPase activating factor [Sporothrix curviconia]|uniref:GTPase activating factor n=1 Tax=Sporothrix curviconia TaxID=1260050 RepID=A0ABP0BWL0_9PEZI
MTDWSDLFEQRLQTVLQDGPGADANAFSSSGFDLDLELAPPPTTMTQHRSGTVQQPSAPSDPTSAFFESIRNQSRPGSRSTGYYAVGGSSAGRSRHAHHSVQYGGEETASRGIFTPKAQMMRASSPVDEMERPGIKELHESYSSRAEELHSEATDRMTEASNMLEAELVRAAAHEDAFLATVADKQFRFSQPAEVWMVKVQMRDNHGGDHVFDPMSGGGPVGGSIGDPAEREERIVDRIAAIRAAAATLESDLERLWAEWGQAHTEATALLHAMTTAGGGDHDDEYYQILAKAEKELNTAAAEANKEMHENEKSFKKTILAEECKLAQMMLSRQSKYD